MGIRTRAEEVVRAAGTEFGEGHVVHRAVVVLAGMDQGDLRPSSSRVSITGLIFM
jgi:hypothetical protein